MFTLNVCSGRIAEKHSPYSPTKKHCRTALNSGHRLKKNPPVWLSHWSSVGVCKGFFDCQHERLTLDSSKPKASGIAVVFKELASVICANQISCVSHNGNRVRSLREKGVWTPPARRIVPQPELNQLQELRSTRWTSWARRQGMINDYTMIMQWSYNDLGFGLWWVVMKEPPCQLYSLLSSDHVMPCKPLRISLSHSPLWTCRRVVLLTGQMAGFCSWCQLCVSARSRSLSLSLRFSLFKQHWLEVSKVEADIGKVQSNISEIMGLPVCTSHMGYQHAWHSEAFQILCLNIFMILLYSGSSHQIILKKRVSFEQLVHAVEAGTSSGSLWDLVRLVRLVTVSFLVPLFAASQNLSEGAAPTCGRSPPCSLMFERLVGTYPR